MSETGRTRWEFVTPQLPVADVRETQAYYRDKLDFKIAWVRGDEYGAVYQGPNEIFLMRESGVIHPFCCFVRVADADAALERIRSAGVPIVEEIVSQPWGMREFAIEELNGHRFRIGHSDGPVHPPEG
ncbi:MAG: VOC family protein [Myxococcota bacterium]